MNQKLYAMCAEIPDAERKRDLGAFFKSIYRTLNHLLYGDKALMGRFVSEPFNIKVIGQELYTNFEELRKAREKMNREILEWSRRLDPDWLEQLGYEPDITDIPWLPELEAVVT